MRPLSLPLPGALRHRALANYALPLADASGWRQRLAGLAFRHASAEQAHASRMCAGLCADLLVPGAETAAAAVLELGCGAGHALAELRRLRPSLGLIGVDASALALKLARRRLLQSRLPGPTPRLYQCQADNLLAVNTGSCLAVMHANCYGAWPGRSLAGACLEAYRVLSPGGRLVATADCRLAGRLAAELGGPNLVDFLTALEAAGFAGIEHRRAACPDTGQMVHVVSARVN